MASIPQVESLYDRTADPAVRGFLHTPVQPNGHGLILSHGAGSNSQSPLLIALASAFAAAGLTVLRCDLPFRQIRPFGPPRPGDAARDREGLSHAVAVMRKLVPGRAFLGGHSYGGRQASMLVAEESKLADGLLLLSYPLHPPRNRAQLRTQHLPNLYVPTLFLHGTRDPFGSSEEIEAALKLIPAPTKLVTVEGAGHDLGFKAKGKPQAGLPEQVLAAFQEFFKIRVAAGF
ncbi:MAG TPA: alpha/beta fold hydrolase [Terriglobales bacterium]|nr:alpha/beta fold hydrolase [Terriglobales bacterium]